jgi:hypothetical protein
MSMHHFTMMPLCSQRVGINGKKATVAGDSDAAAGKGNSSRGSTRIAGRFKPNQGGSYTLAGLFSKRGGSLSGVGCNKPTRFEGA